MSKIFVYGTLKKNSWNHGWLEDSTFVREQAVHGFKLFQSGIPYMIRTDNPEDRVLGEVYEVSEKTRGNIDRLEGHPDWYRREIVSMDSDGEIQGYVYHGYNSGNVQESEKNSNGWYVS